MVEPDISEKNMLNTATTWLRPPLRWPTMVNERLITRCTTLAELISSPTSRKNGMASSASESTPSNIFCTSAAKVTSTKAAPITVPAISENATGTPI